MGGDTGIQCKKAPLVAQRGGDSSGGGWMTRVNRGEGFAQQITSLKAQMGKAEIGVKDVGRTLPSGRGHQVAGSGPEVEGKEGRTPEKP